MVANGGTFSLFADPHTFECHLHLVNQVDLETVLRVKVFVNESDYQVGSLATPTTLFNTRSPVANGLSFTLVS